MDMRQCRLGPSLEALLSNVSGGLDFKTCFVLSYFLLREHRNCVYGSFVVCPPLNPLVQQPDSCTPVEVEVRR